MVKVPGKKRAVKRAKTAAPSRSEAAKRGWETRRARAAEQQAARDPARVSRSEAAKRGWEKRRHEAAAREITRSKRSKAAKEAWAERRETALVEAGLHARSAEAFSDLSADRLQFLHDMRLAVLGPIAYDEGRTGRDANGLEILRTMVQHEDRRWAVFMQGAQKAGFTARQARTAFFSPVPKNMAKSR